MATKENKRGKGWKNYTGGEHPTSKQIIQKTKDGSQLQVFQSMSQASDYLHIDVANISKNCQGQRMSAGGFKFEYKYPTLQKCHKRDLNGQILKSYNTIVVAAIKNNLEENNILKCCLGDIETYSGYKWTFKI